MRDDPVLKCHIYFYYAVDIFLALLFCCNKNLLKLILFLSFVLLPIVNSFLCVEWAL